MNRIRKEFRRKGSMRMNRWAVVEDPDLAGESPFGPERDEEPLPGKKEYDVVVIGGGPAGLAAASYCGRKRLRTAVFESDSWGGILTRWCPDKKIDNYPGLRPGIAAKELADHLIEEARRAEVDLVGGRVEEITRDREVISGNTVTRGMKLIVASGSTASETGIRREREFGGRSGGIFYGVRDPEAFRGKRVVIVGDGDPAVTHARRLSGVAARLTLVHRRRGLRASPPLPEEFDRNDGLEILPQTVVGEFLGTGSVEGVRVRDRSSGEVRDLPADAVILAVGRTPNAVLFRDLELAMDEKGQVVTDRWQRTNIPGIFAVGDVSSHMKMIITAVAQAATAAHRAYLEVRSLHRE